MRLSLPLSVLAAGTVLSVATPAGASTVAANWTMDEPAGATVMHDSSANNNDGHIGSQVQTGVAFGTGSGYRFTAPAASVADPEHLVTVPDSPSLDPGAADITITLKVKTTGSGEYNVFQKGQATTTGGDYKIEINGAGKTPGQPDCAFRGSSGGGQATWASKINDGTVHTIRCTKTASAIGISVDGQTAVTKPITVGSIANASALSIGGKQSCNPAAGVDCDYYDGLIGSAQITVG